MADEAACSTRDDFTVRLAGVLLKAAETGITSHSIYRSLDPGFEHIKAVLAKHSCVGLCF